MDAHIENQVTVRGISTSGHPSVLVGIRSELVGRNQVKEFACEVVFTDRTFSHTRHLKLFEGDKVVDFHGGITGEKTSRLGFLALIGFTLACEAVKDFVRDGHEKAKRPLMFNDEEVALFFSSSS